MLIHQLNITKVTALVLLATFFVPTPLLLPQSHSLKITVDNIKDGRGTVLVALYQSPGDYMKNRFMSLKLQPDKGGKIIGSFDDVPPGVYAVSILHDTNNDMKLNKNGFGIPLEGVGFSNNVIGRFGPPDFEKAAFEFPKTNEILINLKYW